MTMGLQHIRESLSEEIRRRTQSAPVAAWLDATNSQMSSSRISQAVEAYVLERVEELIVSALQTGKIDGTSTRMAKGSTQPSPTHGPTSVADLARSIAVLCGREVLASLAQTRSHAVRSGDTTKKAARHTETSLTNVRRSTKTGHNEEAAAIDDALFAHAQHGEAQARRVVAATGRKARDAAALAAWSGIGVGIIYAGVLNDSQRERVKTAFLRTWSELRDVLADIRGYDGTFG